ncbi:MAG: DUF2232 domain-containing protein [Nitrospinae bacterium]|nr:DUF2232 domain-containing protein [Nitrospinota bacterium]
MRQHPGTIDLKEITLPVLAVLFLFASSLYFPVLGIAVGVFTPLPVIFTYLKWGWANALAVLVIVSAILFSLSGGLFTSVFFIEYGMMAMVMAGMIHRCFLREKVVFLSSALPAFCGIAALIVFFSGHEAGFMGYMKEKIDLALLETIKGYKEAGVGQEHVQALEIYSAQLAELFAKLIPAWLISGSFITASLNYSAIKRVWLKWSGAEGPYFKDPSFGEWVLPDHFVWVFIASGFFLLLPFDVLNSIGVNSLFLSLLVYIIHGMAIIFFWLERKKKGRFLLYMGVFLLMIQPLLLIMIAGLGIFDIWFDFRKLRGAPPPGINEIV